MIPSIIVILMQVFIIGVAVARHGKKYDAEFNAMYSIVSSLIWLMILYWGGFFDKLIAAIW